MKVLIMIYILIGFAFDILMVAGSIYLKEGKARLDDLRALSKKFKKNLNLILVVFFIEMLFAWPYYMFIRKPKGDEEVN